MIYQYSGVTSLSRLLYSVPGGVELILYTPIDNVISIGPISSSTNMLSSIGLKVGASMYAATLPNQKHPYTEAQKQGDGGDYIESVVNAYLPFESIPNHLTLATMKYYQYLVLMKTHSGLIRVIGDLGNGAKFAQAFGSGENTSDANGTAVTFTWQSEDKPALIDSISSLWTGTPPIEITPPPGS